LDESFGPFYSVPSAVGIIIATGNVGKYLSFKQDEVNTYMSRDAGATWFELTKGNQVYEIGDHGGIIVVAPLGRSSTTLSYSFDEGKTLQSFVFSATPIEVANIILEPSTTGEKFILFGTDSASASTVVIGLDFSQMRPRICNASEYEEWTTVDGLNDQACILGHNTTYLRRKQTAVCWNDETTEPIVKVVNCPCTADDWECDYGFESLDGSSECSLADPAVTSYPPAGCQDVYYKTNGYRKVAGDTCAGGVDYTPEGPFDCPETGGSSNPTTQQGWIAAFVIVPIVLILIVVAVILLRSEKLRDKVPILKFLSTWKVGYSQVPPRSEGEDLLLDPEDSLHHHDNDDGNTLSEESGSAIVQALGGREADAGSTSSSSPSSSTTTTTNHDDAFDPRA